MFVTASSTTTTSTTTTTATIKTGFHITKLKDIKHGQGYE